MQFIVIAHDHKDEQALERRLAVRKEHLEFAAKMFEEERWVFASALIDEKGNMNGTVIGCEYDSEEELRDKWLEKEAYVKGDVWKEIIIRKAKFAKH